MSKKDLTILDKKSVFIDKTVKLGKGVIIYENNRIEGNTVIGDNVKIMPNCYIVDCIIGDNTTVFSSVLESSIVENDCALGPYSHLRPNSVIKAKAKIGNFVEIKNAVIGEGSKVNHLAYVGDAEIGKNCNIGCGAIFVNYNGKIKQKTIVGDNCFIGSNCNVIAPVVIENKSYICAGTTVTDKIEEGDFVIGRVRQEVKKNLAKKYLKD